MSEIPYFKGDFWSKEMEDAIEKLNRETQVSKHASGKVSEALFPCCCHALNLNGFPLIEGSWLQEGPQLQEGWEWQEDEQAGPEY